MRRFVIGGVLALGLAGCGGDRCSKQAECAKKAGNSFSETECRTGDTADREKATSMGCTAEYDGLMSCLSALSCDSINNLTTCDATACYWTTTATSNCGAKINLYSKCMS